MLTDSVLTHEAIASATQRFYQKGLHQKEQLLAKIELVNEGFHERVVDALLHTLKQQDHIHAVLKYLEKHSYEGYAFKEMLSWLTQKGVDSKVLAVAAGLYTYQSAY